MKESFRRQIGRLLASALRLQSRAYRPPSGPVLVVAPHADDETLGCGGMLAARACGGLRTEIAFLTDSSAGSDWGPQTALPGNAVAQRQAEALAALATLGVDATHAHFLQGPDGKLDRLNPEEAERLHGALTMLLRAVQPVAVFVPYAGGGSTEHDAAHWLTRAALADCGMTPELWEYPVWAWWGRLRVRRQLGRFGENFHHHLGSLRVTKTKALACHRSQLAALPPALVALCTAPVEFYFHRLDR